MVQLASRPPTYVEVQSSATGPHVDDDDASTATWSKLAVTHTPYWALATEVPIRTSVPIGTTVVPTGIHVEPSPETNEVKLLPLRASRSQFGIGRSCDTTSRGIAPVADRARSSAP